MKKKIIKLKRTKKFRINFDEEKGLPYILYNGKRYYFTKEGKIPKIMMKGE